MLVEFGEAVEEPSIRENALNAENAITNSAHLYESRLFVDLGIGGSMWKQYVMVSIVMNSQSRNKRASSTEGIIRLLLIILWAVVVVVLGFYSGLAYHHQ